MICLTFDTDYMTDDDMERFVKGWDLPGKITFFAHRRFACLEQDNYEICPHPLIDSLQNWEKEVAKIAGELSAPSEGIRTHSCVFSHMIAIGLKKMGYKYSSNVNNLFQEDLRPYRHPWGIWELPIYYMDNMDFCMPGNWEDLQHIPFSPEVITKALGGNGLYIFDIHPLHVALNTHDHGFYLGAREKMRKGNISAYDLRSSRRGVAVFLKELCSAMVSKGQRSYSCSEALQAFRDKRT